MDKQETQHEKVNENSEEQITSDMNIGEVVARFPETAEIMMGYGLHCIGCHVNPYESIQDGASAHGMKQETIDGMVKEMNESVAGIEEKDITLSESAATKFMELMEKENKKGWGLKFTVEPGGCSGYSYVMDFAEKPEADEKVVEEKGLMVFIEKNIFPQVKGVRIDYADGLQGAGFKISNPNAADTCGCGKSFH
ncbi:MAG: iron-sulfur cluster assembly accessory protein [archaeon]|nr:iron-sulfur cluster assembly accessory protein [archaeon]